MSLDKMRFKCFNSECDYETGNRGINSEDKLAEDVKEDGGIVNSDYKKCPKCNEINTLILLIE